MRGKQRGQVGSKVWSAVARCVGTEHRQVISDPSRGHSCGVGDETLALGLAPVAITIGKLECGEAGTAA
jgi:hypothetical protein